jgi:hypothetical protein
MNYTAKRLMVHKPAGQVIDPAVLKKIKDDYNTEFVFYVYFSKEKNMWYYSATTPEKMSTANFLFDKDVESLILFVDYCHSATSTPVHCKPKEEDAWWITAHVGSLSFLTATVESAPRVLFDNFTKFLNLRNLNKFLKSVCKSCPAASFAITTTKGITRMGDNWEEHEGVFFTCLDFLHKISHPQRTFLKNVLSFFSPDTKESIARLDKYTDRKLLAEAEQHPEVIEKMSTI